MKRIRTALCLILAAALLAGCAFLPSDSESETPAPTDPLTGLVLEWQGQRPVAVAIENSTASTTQWGLSSASVVLEALTEVGTSTELCLVYPALAAAPKVGPVAAGQDIYWRLLVGQQPIPVQRGGGQFDQNFLDYYSIRAVDALEAGRTAFDCGSEWSNAPLWYTSGEAISNVLDELYLLCSDGIPSDERRIRCGGQCFLRGRRSAVPPCTSSAGSRRQTAGRHRAGRGECPGLL